MEARNEGEQAGGGPVVYTAGIDEPPGVAEVFAHKADPESAEELFGAARAAGFTVFGA